MGKDVNAQKDNNLPYVNAVVRYTQFVLMADSYR